MTPLQIQLVPPLAWGRNVRAVVAGDTWEALRWHLGAARFRPRFLSIDLPNQLYRDRLKCAYCGTEQRSLDLHELWHYDDERRVQQLIGLEPICSKCHLSVHMGYANATGRTQEALAHLAVMNGWTVKKAQKHNDEAFALWESRATTQYALDVSYLARFNIQSGKIHMDWLDNPRSWVGSRLDAIMWSKRLLDSDAIIVDTETTGLLDKSNVEVIELAAINMQGKSIYQGMFKPRYKIPARVIKIHGITNEAVKLCAPFAHEAGAIREILHGKSVITYNARFDRDVIGRTFKLHKLEGVSARWECAMQTYRTFARSGPYLKLPYGSHRALADCRATLRLIRKIARAEA